MGIYRTWIAVEKLWESGLYQLKVPENQTVKELRANPRVRDEKKVRESPSSLSDNC
jgi:hypothetical protein